MSVCPTQARLGADLLGGISGLIKPAWQERKLGILAQNPLHRVRDVHVRLLQYGSISD